MRWDLLGAYFPSRCLSANIATKSANQVMSRGCPTRRFCLPAAGGRVGVLSFRLALLLFSYYNAYWSANHLAVALLQETRFPLQETTLPIELAVSLDASQQHSRW